LKVLQDLLMVYFYNECSKQLRICILVDDRLQQLTSLLIHHQILKNSPPQTLQLMHYNKPFVRGVVVMSQVQLLTNPNASTHVLHHYFPELFVKYLPEFHLQHLLDYPIPYNAEIHLDGFGNLALPPGFNKQVANSLQHIISSADVHTLIQRIIFLLQLGQYIRVTSRDSQQFQIFNLQLHQRLTIAVQLQNRVDEFKLLKGILVQVVDKDVEVGQEISTNQVTGSIRINRREQFYVFFQDSPQLVEVRRRQRVHALIQEQIEIGLR
jgi:hypothetical protein